LGRQQTSELIQKQPISDQLIHNSDGGHPDKRMAIARDLGLAVALWLGDGSARELRLHLPRLLAILEAIER
jgi:hypothetical protein